MLTDGMDLPTWCKRYGEEYAPTMIATPPEEYPPAARRRTVSPSDQEDVSNNNSDDDDGPLIALMQAIEPINEAANNDRPKPVRHSPSQDKEEQDDDTSFAGDNIANHVNPPNIKQEEVDEELHAHPPRNLSTILDCIQKCRDEISWLQDNPNFHTRQENQTFTQDLRRTIKQLYSQIADTNSNMST